MVVGDFATETEVLVIGGGPAGYTAAIRAAHLGKEVTLVEREALGGVCTNMGCVPSKSLLAASARFKEAADLGEFGIVISAIEVDFIRMQA